jgi:hypothetical protein
LTPEAAPSEASDLAASPSHRPSRPGASSRGIPTRISAGVSALATIGAAGLDSYTVYKSGDHTALQLVVVALVATAMLMMARLLLGLFIDLPLIVAISALVIAYVGAVAIAPGFVSLPPSPTQPSPGIRPSPTSVKPSPCPAIRICVNPIHQ